VEEWTKQAGVSMTRRGIVLASVAVIAVTVGSIGMFLPTRPPPLPDRRAELREIVADQEKESAQAQGRYRPRVKTRIDDLGSPIEDLLLGLPGVVHVEVAVHVDEPACRIVHLRDWHFVPPDLFALDMQGKFGRRLSDAELNRLHEEHCLEVAAVQLEQMSLLGCLINHHGLSELYCEGLTRADAANFRKKIDALREIEENQIKALEGQLTVVHALKAESQEGSPAYQKAAAIETEITAMLWEHTRELMSARPAAC
jgi:hypothetical protein